MNSDIRKFRRFVLALISILFFGLAAGSLAQGKIKVEKSLYRVQVNGIYVHDWHEQSDLFPNPNRVWTTNTGSITSGFGTKGKGVVFRGIRFRGEFPAGTPKPGFQFTPVTRTKAKANNQQKTTMKFNRVPACGGELGECSGNEPKGVETTRKSCRKPNAVLPFAFDSDPGVADSMTLNFGFHQSNYDFCGKKYPFPDSVDELPKTLRVGQGMKLIENLKPGRKQVWRFGREKGEKQDESTDWQPVATRQCPPMSGPGLQRCWTIEMSLEVKRIK
jgi:hypothetical protein